jgi:hypothetical protein
VIKADPGGAEERRRRAKERRRVELRPVEDGMAEVRLTLPAELAEAIHQRLTALARRAACADDPRTLGQIRADVAAALLLGADAGDGDGDGGVQVEVHVTVPATTLLGLADDPGELEGYGPIPADLARELAENATWRRIVTDPVDGTVLDVGLRRYPSAGLARHVRERDSPGGDRARPAGRPTGREGCCGPNRTDDGVGRLLCRPLRPPALK